MQTQLQKWGNSVGLRIPAKLLEQLDLKPGSAVEVLMEGDHLIIRRKQKYTLDALVEHITPENCHDEVFGDDESKGREAW